MKRTLAIALAAGLLFLGGCGKAKAQDPAPAAPPAATVPAATAPAGTAPAANQKADNGVDDMLDQAGQQLNNDDQPAEDED